MEIKSQAVPPITHERTNYGWILVDAKGRAAESLTRTFLLPYYRSEDAAIKAAEEANAKICSSGAKPA